MAGNKVERLRCGKDRPVAVAAREEKSDEDASNAGSGSYVEEISDPRVGRSRNRLQGGLEARERGCGENAVSCASRVDGEDSDLTAGEGASILLVDLVLLLVATEEKLRFEDREDLVAQLVHVHPRLRRRRHSKSREKWGGSRERVKCNH